jgi:hypothetical protein
MNSMNSPSPAAKRDDALIREVINPGSARRGMPGTLSILLIRERP